MAQLYLVRPSMIVQHAYDLLVFALALGLPLYLIFRFPRLWSIPLAAAASWLAIYLGGVILSATEPPQHPSYLDQVWLTTGWIAGLVYASLLFIVRFIVLRFSRHVTRHKA